MQSSFDFRGIRCFPSPSDVRFCYFLPKKPGLQSDANGRPILTMVELGPSAYLLFAAKWAASQGDLDALRNELAIQNREPEVDRIKLSFAPITAASCNALIGDGSGAFETVASSSTSGFPPYDAAFNLFLENDRIANAKAGLRGKHGFLGIEYLAELLVPVNATAIFHARANDLVPWVQSQGAGSQDLPQLLGEAVECRLAEVLIDMPDPADSQLAIELYDRVLAQAAQVLKRWIEQGESGDIHVSVTLKRDGREPVRAFADIGAIVSTESVQEMTGG
jgi:hypothetical protein